MAGFLLCRGYSVVRVSNETPQC
ncbi:hypothetical protein AERO9AM_60109 [Aeromicrobium sp. 9AM]|nr:hypothetical protein AERO9AM_60109 [Aeromicrobium sp. 9AM]